MYNIMEKSRLIEIVENFGKARVAVLGDFCLDLLFHGKHKGFSRESAAPINKIGKLVGYPGAAANVAYNLAKLETEVIPVSVIGTDHNSLINYGDILLNFFKKAGINTDYIFRSEKRETYAYLKFMATGEGTSTPEQQFYRADTGTDNGILLEKDIEVKIKELLKSLKNKYEVLIVSDYSKGIVTPNILVTAEQLVNEDKLVIGSSRRDPKMFNGLNMIALNDFETLSAYVEDADRRGRVDDETLLHYGERLLMDTKSNNLVISRGAHGISIVNSQNKLVNVPTKEKKVVDITGAGDTTLAAIAASLSVGATLVEAAKIGNYAGGIVVQKPGTATASREEILKEIASDDYKD